MASVKSWFQRLRPLQLYFVLFLTAAYFLAQLVVSHVTHALTLLVDSYHVLCNLIALFGCIITIKYGRSKGCDKTDDKQKNNSDELKILSVPLGTVKYASQNCALPERELRNTFGWARIDVLVMLIGCVFLASLCFSLLVEALQTLIHISHLDEMHHPIQVLYLGLTGLALNFVCYLLIGGYTYHQGSFLHVTADGDVVLESVNENSVSNGQRRLSSQTRRVHVPLQPPKRQGLWETCRDVIGCVFVILCAALVYFTNQDVAKYIDPILSIVSAILLLIFSYPYMKESCLILLQTIPDHINMDSLKTELLSAFPDIVNIHDFHVWQLTVNKTISTVHIIFLNPQVYCRITDDIKKFFEAHGISHVTVQPEFFKDMNSVELVSGYGAAQCLVQCLGEECLDCQCCSSTADLRSISVSSGPKTEIKEGNNVSNMKKTLMISNSLPTMTELCKEGQENNSFCSLNMPDKSSIEELCDSSKISNTGNKNDHVIYSSENLNSTSDLSNLDNSCKEKIASSSIDNISTDSKKSEYVYVDNVLIMERKNEFDNKSNSCSSDVNKLEDEATNKHSIIEVSNELNQDIHHEAELPTNEAQMNQPSDSNIVHVESTESDIRNK